jgi:hypothetical protein
MNIGELLVSLGVDTTKLDKATQIVQGFATNTVNATKKTQEQLEKVTKASENLSKQMDDLDKVARNLEDTWRRGGISLEHREVVQKQSNDNLRDRERAEKEYIKTQEKVVELQEKLSGSMASHTTLLSAFGQALTNFATNPLRSTQMGMANLLTTLGPTAVGIGGVVTAVGIAGFALHKAAENAREYATEMVKLSSQTGLSIDQVQAFSRAGVETGVSMGEMARSVGQLQKQLGKTEGGEFTKVMASLGISIYDMDKNIRPLMDILADFSDYLHKMPNAAERGQLAWEAMNSRMRMLIGLVNSNTISFREYMKELEKFPIMSDGTVKALGEHNIELEKTLRNWERLKLSVGSMADATEIAVKRAVGNLYQWYQHTVMVANVRDVLARGGTVQDFVKAGMIHDPNKPAPVEWQGPKEPDATFGNKTGLAAVKAREDFVKQTDEIIKTGSEWLDLRLKINAAEEEYTRIKTTSTDPKEIDVAAKRVMELKDLLIYRKEDWALEQQIAKEAPVLQKHLEDELRARRLTQDQIDFAGMKAGGYKAKQVAIDEEKINRVIEHRLAIYKEAESALQRYVTKSDLDQLHMQEQMVATIMPMNEAERRRVQEQKIYLEFAIKAEELRVKYAQEELTLRERIAKLLPGDPLRIVFQDRLNDILGGALGKDLDQLMKLRSASLYKAQLQEYIKIADEVKNLAGSFFDAIMTKGKSAFQNILDWLRTTFMSMVRTIFQNLMVGLFTPQAYGGIFSGIPILQGFGGGGGGGSGGGSGGGGDFGTPPFMPGNTGSWGPTGGGSGGGIFGRLFGNKGSNQQSTSVSNMTFGSSIATPLGSSIPMTVGSMVSSATPSTINSAFSNSSGWNISGLGQAGTAAVQSGMIMGGTLLVGDAWKRGGAAGVGEGAAGGAATGAAIGMPFAGATAGMSILIGAAVGAIVGGIVGFFGGGAAGRSREAAARAGIQSQQMVDSAVSIAHSGAFGREGDYDLEFDMTGRPVANKRVIVNFNGPVYGMEDFKDQVSDIASKAMLSGAGYDNLNWVTK